MRTKLVTAEPAIMEVRAKDQDGTEVQSCDDGNDNLGEEGDKLAMLYTFICKKKKQLMNGGDRAARWISYARNEFFGMSWCGA
jgi:hypothetical protein